MTFSIMTLIIKGLYVTLNITMLCHYAKCHYAECCVFIYLYTECHYAECRLASAITLNVIMLSGSVVPRYALQLLFT
jgi:hypothetical protein